MKDKVIAIAPPAKQKELVVYTSWLDHANLAYKILDENESSIDYDALLLTGGADIGKGPKRDEQEFKWFKQAYGKIPIVGICRGMQLANLALGGTLYDDLSEETFIKHTTNKELISEEVTSSIKSSWHNVQIVNFSLFIKENSKDDLIIIVNSRHHQGVKEIANTLKTVAISPNDGLVEALENENCLLVQWHPERLEARDKSCSNIVLEWLRYNFSKK